MTARLGGGTAAGVRFEGAVEYVATEDLKAAVNASIRLERPLLGALSKNEQDVHLFERLAFLARRQGGVGFSTLMPQRFIRPLSVDTSLTYTSMAFI